MPTIPTFRRNIPGTSVIEPAAPVAPVVPPSQPAPRRNLYAARCVECKVEVPPGGGLLSKGVRAWEVRHDGECPAPEAPLPSIQSVVDGMIKSQPSRNIDVNGNILYDGIYTLEKDTRHRTIELATQPLDVDFKPGAQIISYLSGPDNEDDYTRCGHVVMVNGVAQPQVWAKHRTNVSLVADLDDFFNDPSTAVLAARCFACHRRLTVPTSVYAGYGPECRKKN